MRALVLLAALLALAAAAPAPAAQPKRPPDPRDRHRGAEPRDVLNPYFKALKVKHVRVITAWDSLRHKWSRDALDAYMAAARAAKVRVLLGFGHSRSPKRKVRRYVPGVREFTEEFLKYKKRYPWVKEWLTWNEANHCGEPTCHRPRRVARFYNNIRHNCYGCTVVAADVLDTPSMPEWVREFRRTARNDKPVWGLHNYIDANRFRTSGTTGADQGGRPAGKIWFTETGGLVVRRNGSRIAFPGNKKHAARATKQVFKLAGLQPPRAADLLLPLDAVSGAPPDVGLRARRPARQAAAGIQNPSGLSASSRERPPGATRAGPRAGARNVHGRLSPPPR